MDNEKFIVQHIDKQFSDHCMLLLDIKPELAKKKKRFYFDKRWVGKPGVEDVIRLVWESECFNSPMFKVATKIKRCRMELLK